MERIDGSAQTPCLAHGSIGTYLDHFISHLKSAGYKQSTIDGYIGSVSHFGWWCSNQGKNVEKIDDSTVAAFSKHDCICPGNRSHKFVSIKYLKRVQRFIEFLKNLGVLETPACAVEPPEPILPDFRDWLFINRGLSRYTIDKYARLVNKLLPSLGNNPYSYNAREIRQVISKEICQCSRAQAKSIITALRAYLRYLATTGQGMSDLSAAIPSVAEWRLSSMPRYIDADSVKCLIDSCDLNTTLGIRDRAVLLLLSRLGLRAGDIANMHIDDFNWAEGTVRVRGKGRVDVLLPLSQDVGDSILEYLENARPKVTIDKVFLCTNAPYRAFTSSASVSDIVRLALKKAGIENAPSRGANLLRHSAATIMLRNGATLETISAVLRHRSADMSAYYAKVDINMLKKIAQPWPGVTHA